MSLQSYRRKQVKTYREHSYHVGCGGEWLFEGSSMSTTFETKYLHRCDKCRQLQELSDRFPRLIHEER